MKKIFALLAIYLFLQSATGQDNLQMTGAWMLTKQVANDGNKDTLLKQEQLKIYTDRHMMYASPRSTDSFGEYGIATYSKKGDRVVENIFYTSSAGEVNDSALLKVSKLKDGYRQVIDYSDANGKFLLTEDYKKAAAKPVRTLLDGAWKQVKNISINKKGDTTHNTVVTQFKVYQSGYFIWANPSRDPSSNNFVTAYGYGTFNVNGNKCRETNINSTYQSLVGKPVDIAIETITPNIYKQTIVSDAGDRSVEVYERLK